MRPDLALRRIASEARGSFEERYLHDFTFIHVNKTGGTSVGRALGLRFGHRTARQRRAELGPKRWEQRFSFAFVRNPWDRAVSLYSYRTDRGRTIRDGAVIPFDEWVELTFGADRAPSGRPEMVGPQLDWLTDEDGTMLVDYVGRFERLSEDFAHVCAVIGREDVALPHVKASSRSAYPDYYDDRTRQIVAKRFAPDIEAFGYRFGE